MDVHDEVGARLARLDQRYTSGRRAIVDVLAAAARPLTVSEIMGETHARGVPQSSAYRHLTVLLEAGAVHRVPGAGDLGRFELAEDLTGHHHHLVCADCGRVTDVPTSAVLEAALRDASGWAADETGFEVTGHRIDLIGRCGDCRAARPA